MTEKSLLGYREHPRMGQFPTNFVIEQMKMYLNKALHLELAVLVGLHHTLQNRSSRTCQKMFL